MPGDRNEGGDGLPDPLVAVIADPEQGRHRLPYVLGLVDGDDARERLAASVALCLVVDAYPSMRSYVVERLVDRLDDDAPVEVGHALDYLAAREPKAVDSVVSDLDEERERRARGHLFQSGGGFARSEYLLPTTGDRPVGRTRVAGSTTEEDPRRVRTTEPGDGVDPRVDDPGEDAADADGDAVDADDTAADADAETADAADANGEPDGATPGPSASEAGVRPGSDVTSGTLAVVSRRLSEVVERSRFDDIDVLTDRSRERYGDAYRSVGTLDGEEYPVGLTVFRVPSDGRRAFLSRYRAAMERWTAVDDHDRIQRVHDWGIRPRPWAALEYTAESLTDRAPTSGEDGATTAERARPDSTDEGDPVAGAGDPAVGAGEGKPSIDAAVATVLDLADGVAHAHQHGVVHGALDPVNVRFRGTELSLEARRRPLVGAPGLTLAYAGRAGVGDFLDPRYAPPEYYDDSVGDVDHVTDVYALGLLLYRLTTGRHPYDGPLDAVREEIVAGSVPRPSAVEPAVPRGIDRVVEKATARGKLKRYETVNALRGELRRIGTNGG